MSALDRIVVVGGSLAGLRTAQALRRRGYGGKLTLVGAEPHLPYDRPPLSKQVLDGTWPVERTRLCDADTLVELDVEPLLGRRAEALDGNARELTLDGGERLSFDALVIATGATPRRLPAAEGLAGAHVLRSLDDAIGLRRELEAGPRVVVVGGGFIGLEVASSCRTLGLEVTVVEAAPRPLEGVLGPDMAEAVCELHRDAGVTLRSGVGVAGFEGEGRVEGVRLDDGSVVPADVVVVGIGVTPAVGWLEGSGVTLENGVVCDDRLATRVDGVVAVGDVARWPNPVFGRSMRVEHWTNAVEQADAAAARLLDGADATPPFASVPYFWSDQLGVKLQFAGSAEGCDAVQVIEGSMGERKLVALYGRQGRVTGVLAVNRPPRLIQLRRRIGEGLAWDDAIAEAR